MNLVKWGEGGLSYEYMLKAPFDEILAINREAIHINREMEKEMKKGR